MAIATAQLLGYELTINFDFPCFSRSVTEFWRRWHISLSTWFRDYLYISLGGNRGSKAFVYRNLMLTTMVLGMAFWHWRILRFSSSGEHGMPGLALIVHREWQRLPTANAGAVFKRVMAVLAMPLTFYWVCLAWIFFRATTLLEKHQEAEKVWYTVKETGFHVATTTIKSMVLFSKEATRSILNGRAWPCLPAWRSSIGSVPAARLFDLVAALPPGLIPLCSGSAWPWRLYFSPAE